MGTGLFQRSRKGVVVTFDTTDTQILAHVLTELLELLGPDEGEAEDPLAAAVGIGASAAPPEDPALARLFPDGYRDDQEAAADFRRYTEPGLRSAKREAIQRALGTLDRPGEKRQVSPAEADAWLHALTDVRLVLGERLGITEDWEEQVAALPDDDPLLGVYWLYDRLTVLQESLVRALW